MATTYDLTLDAEVASAQTYAIKGGASVQWGVGPTLAEKGTITDISCDTSAKNETVENQYGAIIGMVIYDTETSLKLTIVAKGGTTPAAAPTPGQTLTVTDANNIGTVKGVITGVSVAAQNKSVTKYTVTVSGWTNFEPGTTAA